MHHVLSVWFLFFFYPFFTLFTHFQCLKQLIFGMYWVKVLSCHPYFFLEGVFMKRLLLLTAGSILIGSASFAQTAPAPSSVANPAATTTPAVFSSKSSKLGYAVGLSISDSVKGQADFDMVEVVNGLKDGLEGRSKLTDQERQEVITSYQTEVQVRREAEMKAMGEKNLKDGTKFLEDNKSKPGVIVLKSGLQYKIISEAPKKKGVKSVSPKASDTVTVHYKGTLIDGTEFDSSYRRNQPATLPLSGVIKGWGEGLQQMKVGDKYIFYIPSNLAYEDRALGAIGPNSVLIFEVELISIGAPKA
ncbi:FKBP-type peptidyl-prolyl cis-trans isomerase [bacterium]|nr:FKBP-type peptidyl-prolyl cis-trans isomerase [bacterium]